LFVVCGCLHTCVCAVFTECAHEDGLEAYGAIWEFTPSSQLWGAVPRCPAQPLTACHSTLLCVHGPLSGSCGGTSRGCACVCFWGAGYPQSEAPCGHGVREQGLPRGWVSGTGCAIWGQAGLWSSGRKRDVGGCIGCGISGCLGREALPSWVM